MADVLKEFLVNIQYRTSGEQNVRKNIDEIGKRLAGLAGAAEAAAGAVVLGVAKMASSFEQLYFASQRTRATAENIRAVGYAAGQLGSSADAASGSLENLGRFLRNNPGGGAFLRGLGVDTNRLTDTAAAMEALGRRFARQPFWQANAYAQVLGIDERTLMALRDGSFAKWAQAGRDIYHRMGLDAQAAAKSSHDFMNQFRTLGLVFGALQDKITGALAQGLSGTLARFQEWLIANSGAIALGVERAAQGVIFLASALNRLGGVAGQTIGRMVEWFKSLNPETQHWIEGIGGVLVAWRLLSAGILATPLGRMMALLSAVLLLIDDYQTWQRGGRSAIDWSKWDEPIQKISALVKEVAEGIDHVVTSMIGKNGWARAFEVLLGYVATRWAAGMVGAIGRVSSAFSALTAPAWLLRLMGAAGLLALTGPAGGEDPAFSEGKNEEYLRAHPPGSSPVGDWLRRHLPAWMTGAGLDQRAGGIRDRLMQDLGLTREQASGLVGNLVTESGLRGVNERNPIVPGSRGGFGWAQWTADRRVNFERWAAENHMDPASDAANYGFLLHELRGPYASTVAALRRETSAADAARTVFRMYESGGDVRAIPRWEERIANSTRLAAPPAPAAGTQLRGTLSGWGWHFRDDGTLGTRAPNVAFGPPSPLLPPSVSPAASQLGAQISQSTQITVHGSDDPHTMARAIGHEQDRVNANLLRNAQGATR